MRGRAFAVPAAGLAAVLLAGCTGTAARQASEPGPASSDAPASSASSAAASDVPPSQTLRCDASIDGVPPPADYQVVLGAVALPTSPRHRALQAADSGGGSDVPALFAKTGLVIRAGVPAQLEVGAADGNRVGIGWGGGPSAPTRRVDIAACPDARGTGWLAYPGGYWADRPLCLSLVVRSLGTEQQVRIGIGRACPNQQPPFTP